MMCGQTALVHHFDGGFGGKGKKVKLCLIGVHDKNIRCSACLKIDFLRAPFKGFPHQADHSTWLEAMDYRHVKRADIPRVGDDIRAGKFCFSFLRQQRDRFFHIPGASRGFHCPPGLNRRRPFVISGERKPLLRPERQYRRYRRRFRLRLPCIW